MPTEEHIAVEYPLLMHYTTFSGLEGILGNNSLWATNYRHLNDSSEFEFALPWTIENVVKSKVHDFEKSKLCQQMSRGKLVTSNDLETIFREVVTKSINSQLNALDKEGYVFSMCAPTTDDVRKHGALSMWRAYAPNGGVAIEFDSGKLLTHIGESESGYELYPSGIRDVVYSNQTEKIEKILRPAIDSIGEYILRMLGKISTDPNEPAELGDALANFITLISRFKHWAFHEEHEVRIVEVPVNVDDWYRAEAERIGYKPRKQKPRQTRLRNGFPVPFIEIGKLPDKKLPITRVIVGPHHAQKRHVDAVRPTLESLGIPLSSSEIPYLSAG